ncbi:metal ABC transporter solute-binding protein, Zn/Mn family [Nesterenkonia alkaliphila]|uniref:Zinc ABC transporter solute-binding protein n=1 Tax=Nesterenkonia alkaliphila TaxID=1463631 RepID=A0A7K1UI50_9MICC|nr:zinc ABC transporter substrate-binding protein [Nesterenkonia alkaliphila]MVT26145.1 zinc ABC transporter solute-binding protein [Nesterenkonia alkaliphila]
MQRSFLAAAACVGVVVLSSCGNAEQGTEPLAQEDAELADTGLTVVASIDVYTDLVQGIAGDTVEVQPLVASTAVDPHSYEATPQDRMAVENADIIIANGGGYDSFITLLASAADKDQDVYQLIEGENWHSHDFDGTWENEHVWYDLERMSEFVQDFAEHLGQAAPENAEYYTENAAALAAEIDALAERTAALDAAGHSYFATEAVSGFLLEDAGFDNATPLEFLNAVEHGEDVSPRLYSDALDLAAEVELLSYNPQTETQQSARIRDAAADAGAVVVEFTETLPDDSEGYLEWMAANIDIIEGALQEIE